MRAKKGDSPVEERPTSHSATLAQAPQEQIRRPVLVGVVMGSKSDYEVLAPAVEILKFFDIPHEARVVSAHRTPDWLFKYAEQAEGRGLRVIIAGAGGAAHLPGMLAAKTLVPVLGVPVPATMLNGIDSLLSIVQMPKGVPVGTLGDRQAGCGECGTVCGGDSGADRWRSTGAAACVARRAARGSAGARARPANDGGPAQ